MIKQLQDVFNSQVNKAFSNSTEFAQTHKLEFITIDMFFLCLADSPVIQKMYADLGLDVKEVANYQLEYINENIPSVKEGNTQPSISVMLKNIIDNSITLAITSKQASSLDEVEISEKELFISLMGTNSEDSALRYYLQCKDIQEGTIVKYFDSDRKASSSNGATIAGGAQSLPRNLIGLLINLNDKFNITKDNNIVGRDKEIEQMSHILSRKTKRNPILVGDAGVGKTSIVEGFVKSILNKTANPYFNGFTVYSINMNLLFAGAKYRGDVEERIDGIFTWASKTNDVIIFIDEIHTIISNSNKNNGDIASIIKPYLDAENVKIIGATTFKEYQQYFQNEPAFARRFYKIDVVEPNVENAIKILKTCSKSFETFHSVKYTEESLVEAVKLSHKFINDKRLPDKAIDLIDIAGATAKLSNEKIVGVDNIKSAISKLLNISLENVSVQEKDKLKTLNINLNKYVFGQQEAVNKVSDMIILAKANISNKEKPIASFLFAGPSGVGKTELAKQLSKQLNVPFVRFDMSEFMEAHSVSKFLGSPPGYVGSEKGGLLINMGKKTPNAVFLFDEIEKAHPDVLNTFLQMMDYGVATDSFGNKADFQNAIIIMTSNIGASAISKNSIGFNAQEQHNEKNVAKNRNEAIKKALSPEFINRLDGIIQFSSINVENAKHIVVKCMNELQASLREKEVFLSYNDEVINWLVKNGFNKDYGARPLERCISNNITQTVAKSLLFGEISEGDSHVSLSITDDKIIFNYSKSLIKDDKIVISPIENDGDHTIEQ